MMDFLNLRLTFYSLLPFDTSLNNKNFIFNKTRWNKDLLIFKAINNIIKQEKQKNYKIKIKKIITFNKNKKIFFRETILRSSYKDKVGQLSFEKKVFKLKILIKLESFKKILFNFFYFFKLIEKYKFFESKLIIQFSKEVTYFSIYKF